MKKNRTIIMVLFFFMGLLVLLYPSISDFYNQKVQSKVIVDYEALLKDYSKEDYTEFFEAANKYNKKLASYEDPFLSYKKVKNYKKTINIDGNGMMGYISIDKIKVELPIYHGTSEQVLSVAVGHLQGSSLPVGGLGTHAVLSAHRGLPSTKLFSDLDKLEIGDTFTITVLDQLLTYQVDQIEIVEPHDITNLKIDPEKDYLTLMTCTPYGINTHRMLVRGVRIENTEKPTYVTTEAFRVSNLTTTPMVAIPIVLTILIIIVFQPVNMISKNKLKEMYIYPTKTKKEFGGNKNEKNKKK